MKVCVCITWKIIVDGQVDALNVDTAPKDICGDTNSFVEVLEAFISSNSRVRDYSKPALTVLPVADRCELRY